MTVTCSEESESSHMSRESTTQFTFQHPLLADVALPSHCYWVGVVLIDDGLAVHRKKRID